MSARRLQLVLGSLVVAALAATLVAVHVRKHNEAPARVTGAGAITSAEQLASLLPRSVGSLRRQEAGAPPEGGKPFFPQCVQPFLATAPSPSAPPAAPPLEAYAIQPVIQTVYGSHGDYFTLNLFRFNAHSLRAVRRILSSASKSCLDKGEGLLYNRLPETIGDASAIYQGFSLPYAHEPSIRVPQNIQMTMLSGMWAITIYTQAAAIPVTANLSVASMLSRQLPGLLHWLDHELKTSFASNMGMMAHLSFPPLQVYLAEGAYGGRPTYRPNSIMLSGDSSFGLDNMSWVNWTQTGAQGTGTVAVNLCTPSCAAASWRYFRARVSLSAPSYKCDYPFFSKMIIHWLAARPAGSQQNEIHNVQPYCQP